jgi:hypothetical protein
LTTFGTECKFAKAIVPVIPKLIPPSLVAKIPPGFGIPPSIAKLLPPLPKKSAQELEAEAAAAEAASLTPPQATSPTTSSEGFDISSIAIDDGEQNPDSVPSTGAEGDGQGETLRKRTNTRPPTSPVNPLLSAPLAMSPA